MDRIPIKPFHFIGSLKEEEQNALTWYVLSNCTKEYAYTTFINPALKVSATTLKKAVNMFFDSADAIAYMDEYKNTLKESLSPSKALKRTPEDVKKRKEEAVGKLMDFVLRQADHIESAENPEDIIKYADKLGLLEGEEEHVETPRRYLPVSCSECQYRKFIEENCDVTD